MKHILKLLIGGPVLILVLSLIAGGLSNAFYLLFVSIICTAGVGLIFWIPLSYATGSIVLYLVSFLNSKGRKPPTETEKTASLTNNEIALINYIKQAIQNGSSQSQTTALLKASGWQDEAIEKAYNLSSR